MLGNYLEGVFGSSMSLLRALGLIFLSRVLGNYLEGVFGSSMSLLRALGLIFLSRVLVS